MVSCVGKKKMLLALLAILHLCVAEDGMVVNEPLPSMPSSYFASPEAPLAPDDPTPEASLTPCPGGSNFDVCIESGLTIFSQSPTSIPPDPHGAAGLTSLIAVTNSQVEGIRKDGSSIFGPTRLAVMFAPLSPVRLFDPKIRFDVHRQRFVLVVLDRNVVGGNTIDSNIFVAVSKNSNPLSASSADWYLLKIPSLINNAWADYPGVAVDEEALYITNNMFASVGNAFSNSLLWIIHKEPLYSGGAAIVNTYDYIALAGTGFRGTHMPAMVRSPTGIAPNVGTYLVQYDGISNGSTESIQIIQVNNPLTSPTFQRTLVNVGNIDDTSTSFLGGPQLGTTVRTDSGDRRALDAVWANNRLWMTFVVRDAAGEASTYWIKFNANGVAFPPTVAGQGLINGETIAAGTYTYYPSVDVNSKGVAAFGFAASSPTIYASAYGTIRDDILDPAGTVRNPSLMKAGEAPYFIQFGGTRNRWGDYTSVSLDPSNEDCFWVFNEYAGLQTYTTDSGQFGSWKTAWGRLCYIRPTNSPTKAPTKSPTKTPTKRPTKAPTKTPTKAPTKAPTKTPTKTPTKAPTKSPTKAPTKTPTKAPTNAPTKAPTQTNAPTKAPIQTNAPTKAPTQTNAPTKAPIQTNAPTKAPTQTNAPTKAPTQTNAPTKAPTQTNAPTKAPIQTNAPTKAPTQTSAPTKAPTQTNAPTKAPTQTNAPTKAPTQTSAPTKAPTQTNAPTKAPTSAPTKAPTQACHTTYYIWNSTSNVQVAELTNGWVGCITHPFNLEARLCQPPSTTPVLFKLSSNSTVYIARSKEYTAPWFLFGDSNGDVYSNTPDKALINHNFYTLQVTVDGVTKSVNFRHDCP